jgi:glycosyltransferase involved in cell wall biosynthesis
MKKVVVSLEHHFYEWKGNYYTKLAFPNSYWCDYLNFFDEVYIIGRVKKVNKHDENFQLVTSASVHMLPLEHYKGPKQFLCKLPKLLFLNAKYAFRYKNFILRSGNVSNILWIFIIFFNRTYLREFPGNIKNGIIGVAGDTLTIKILAEFLDWFAKIQAKFSNANGFVSNDCKSIYQSKKKSFVFSSFLFSEISLTKQVYKLKYELIDLVCLGRLEGEKGHSDLLNGIELLRINYGIKARLTLIGDGTKKEQLLNLANKLNVDVIFTGAITDRVKLFKTIIACDLFVLPSHTEGMPRALLEAMAAGLPCIGSNVGGIPEVLGAVYLFEPNDGREIAEKVSEVLTMDLKSIGQNNRELIEYMYDEKKMLKIKFEYWENLY